MHGFKDLILNNCTLLSSVLDMDLRLYFLFNNFMSHGFKPMFPPRMFPPYHLLNGMNFSFKALFPPLLAMDVSTIPMNFPFNALFPPP